VAAHTADLVLEDFVVEAGLKLSLPGAGGRDVASVLTTAEADKVLLGQDGGAVEGRVGDVRLEHVELRGRDELWGE
jgi:hypothetical protein